MTVQEALEQRKQNMEQAEQIREEAIANGTWGTKSETTTGENMAVSKYSEELQERREEITQAKEAGDTIREDAIENGTWGAKSNSNVEETVSTPTETMPTPEFYGMPLLFGAGGFVLGVLVAVLACSIRIKKIKSECETRVSEARASLDRMISMMSKE